MKREARLLSERAVDAVVLGVEIFNRPSDRGRTEAVLIHLDHSFEMLLKAAILHRGGRIREQGDPHTIGFDHCLRVAVTQGNVRFLSEEDAVVLRSLNSLRDAAQHYLLNLSEQQLYIHAQSSVTLFRTIMRDVLGQDLTAELPDRVLPLSTTPPLDLQTMFDSEVEEVKKLLEPGKRRRIEALAKLRGLAILQAAIEGKTTQPTIAELHSLGSSALKGKPAIELFPGIANVNLTATGHGPTIELRITKAEGIPIHLVKDNVSPGTPVIAVKRIDDLGFYNLGRDTLAEKVGLNGMMTTAMIWYLKLQDDPDCHKEIVIGSSRFHRYSPRSIEKIRDALKTVDVSAVWDGYKKRRAKGTKYGSGAVVPQSAAGIPA